MPKITPLFARQPIFDANSKVVAYELLFRSAQSGSAAGALDGDQATAQVLLKVFGEHKIDEVTGGKKAFVNYTRKLLLSPPLLPPNQLVVEVLEDIEPDKEVINALKNLKKRGFTIALDDFLLTDKTQKFIPFADIIKVDVLAHSTDQLVRHTRVLKKFNTTLLAEKVEDHQMMQLCKNLGYDYFQGYFLCKPEVVRGVSISEGKQTILQLIGQLNSQNVEISDIVQTIATDPALSYKILRLINSSAIGLTRKIESLNQAVTLLGITAIRNWATFLLLANNDTKPAELCVISMTRAKLCETLGQEIGGKSLADSCFTAGLLTNIDAFLDLPMMDVLKRLTLSGPIENALLKYAGDIGKILEIAKQYECGDWTKIDWSYLETKKIPAKQVNIHYGNSIIWASQMMNSQV